jgi:hypothetical protein
MGGLALQFGKQKIKTKDFPDSGCPVHWVRIKQGYIIKERRENQ